MRNWPAEAAGDTKKQIGERRENCTLIKINTSSYQAEQKQQNADTTQIAYYSDCDTFDTSSKLYLSFFKFYSMHIYTNTTL
jgi:hypothetical protein